MALTLSETRLQPIAALIRRTQAMRPWLRERQIDCETGGNIPQDVNAELIRYGFYRMLQPRRTRFGLLERSAPRGAKAP